MFCAGKMRVISNWSNLDVRHYIKNWRLKTGTKIIDRILIFCAKLSIVSCELNVVHVLMLIGTR